MRLYLPVFRWGLGIALIALTASATPRFASAQSILHKQTREKLGAHVQLDLDATTVSRVMAALSAQTGLNIQAAAYLNPHRMTLQIEDASAEDVLNTLAEMNGWRWYENEAGAIVLSRLRVTAPQQMTAISAMLKAAMPIDIWRYLGIDQSPRLRDLYTQTQFIQQANNQNSGQASSGGDMNKRVLQTGNDLARLLPDIANGKPVPYQKLTPEQQRTLLACMFMGNAMGFNGIMGQGLMHNEFQPFELDTSKLDVSLNHGRVMHISSTTIEGTMIHKSGFGAPIDYEELRNKVLHRPQP